MIYPSFSKVLKLTSIVLGASIIFGGIFSAIDYAVTLLVKII